MLSLITFIYEQDTIGEIQIYKALLTQARALASKLCTRKYEARFTEEVNGCFTAFAYDPKKTNI